MTNKHIKTTVPTDADLKGNPGIGSSKGVTMSQSSSEDLEEIQGENTIEGDVENDTNPHGGVDKDAGRG
jgi:hypothetical protein